MRAGSVKRLVRWGAAILVLFLTVGHGSPQSAFGACNHLVSSIHLRSLGWNHLDRSIVGGSSIGAEDESLFPSDLPARRSCSGLSCSSHDPASSSSASEMTGGHDHWGNLTVVLLDRVAVRTEMIAHPASPHARSGSPDIFHPPPV
jgi:hypothetical protein